jgi:Glycosyl transferase family 2
MLVRLVMTLLVRDEEELLASNLDYHLRQGVDFVLVTDHQSTDATSDILAEYEKHGVVKVLHAEGAALDQGGWVTRMARLAATDHGADWVLNNDADEFWWPLAGTLKDMLAVIPQRYGQLAVPRHNFIPRPGDGAFWERMTIREAESHNLVGDELEPNGIHRAHPDVVVDHGNHWLAGPDLPPAPRLPLIEVLHFPIRTWEQFEHKVTRAGPAYLALGERGPEVGRDQLTLYDVHRRGELREWFEAAMLDGARIEAGLASGELVVDRRLERFMGALARGEEPVSDSAAERLAVRRMADVAFGAAPRAEAAERELAETRARLAETEVRLGETAADLERLRASRLFRWTRGPRRAFYRTRGWLRGGGADP